ncbi:hypothetical protein PCC7424_2105 [Gloeothece citriformis PCC 7424]|uniref:Uncharacterized protein n=1 Tax=Gloeothece citriformis (strain PCC 7424) TaxID=65393 RepID=B7KG61_GLOC7|nr:hypothetical protein [Gloeothece citriformis]ACK70532.1 hypothetical protein PCC7424_2105 [Gloeothece citriformis PCC 7424]
MFAVYLILLFIVFLTVWIISNDQDEVHQMAAVFTAIVALIWFFSIATIPIKLLLALPIFFYFHKIYSYYK